MPQLPFSSFQRLMIQWDHLSAQNSAQVCVLEGGADPELVELAWQSTLRDLGLGRVFVTPEGYSHEIWTDEPPAPLVNQSCPSEPIEAYLQVEINRPFPPAPSLPYRPFFLQQGKVAYLGIIYQQWVADSVAIRLLLREWYLRIFAPQKARRKLIDLPRIHVAGGPVLGFSPSGLLRGLEDCWKWWRSCRTLSRFPAGTDDNQTILRPLAIPAMDVDRLLLITRAEGCTVNDLLIAVLAGTLFPELTPMTGAGSPTIALATSIDLRPYLPGNLSETFGSLLSYSPVICPAPQQKLINLAQVVARQTRRIKNPERIAAKLFLPRLIARWASRQKPENLAAFYARRIPVAATVSSVNLNKSWPALYSPLPIQRYIRVAAPGPAVPLALTASTLGSTMDITFTARRGVISENLMDRITAGFARNLQSLLQ